LRVAEGATNREIAQEVGLSGARRGARADEVGHEGLAGLANRQRTGRPHSIDDATVQQVIARARSSAPTTI